MHFKRLFILTLLALISLSLALSVVAQDSEMSMAEEDIRQDIVE